MSLYLPHHEVSSDSCQAELPYGLVRVYRASYLSKLLELVTLGSYLCKLLESNNALDVALYTVAAGAWKVV